MSMSIYEIIVDDYIHWLEDRVLDLEAELEEIKKDCDLYFEAYWKQQVENLQESVATDN